MLSVHVCRLSFTLSHRNSAPIWGAHPVLSILTLLLDLAHHLGICSWETGTRRAHWVHLLGQFYSIGSDYTGHILEDSEAETKLSEDFSGPGWLIPSQVGQVMSATHKRVGERSRMCCPSADAGVPDNCKPSRTWAAVLSLPQSETQNNFIHFWHRGEWAFLNLGSGSRMPCLPNSSNV